MKNTKFKPNEKEAVDEFFEWRGKAKFNLNLSENYDADYKIYMKEVDKRRWELTLKLAKLNGFGRALSIWKVYSTLELVARIDKIVKRLIDWYVDTGMFWLSMIGILAVIYIICEYMYVVIGLMQ